MLCWFMFLMLLFIASIVWSVISGLCPSFCRLLCMALVFVQSLEDLCLNLWLEVLLLDSIMQLEKMFIMSITFCS